MAVVGNIGAGASALLQNDEIKAIGYAFEKDGTTFQSWHYTPGFQRPAIQKADAEGPQDPPHTIWSRRSTVWDDGDWRDYVAHPNNQPGLRAEGVVIGRSERWPEATEDFTAMLLAIRNVGDDGAEAPAECPAIGPVQALIHDGTLSGHRLDVGTPADLYWYQLWQLDTRCRPPDLKAGYTAAPDFKYTASEANAATYLNAHFQGGWLRCLVKLTRASK
ncbi:MAG: hypothetical protein ACI9OJ_002545 [Myxococcota bacterium]|jgi:hypothetical protein